MERSGWHYRLAYDDSQKFISDKNAMREISFFYEALRLCFIHSNWREAVLGRALAPRTRNPLY